jgi:HSP20 family protein
MALREILEQVLAEHRRNSEGGDAMPINVFQEEDAVIVEAALPGVDEKLIDLSCDDHVLTIRARHQVPEREYLHQEIVSADYQRQVALPGDCRFEEAVASFEGGILQVRIPKERPRTASRIRIQVTRRGPAAQTIAAEPADGAEAPGS